MNNETKTYQGWKNYETWAVNLWLTNDQRSAQWLKGIATNPDLEDYEKAEQLKTEMQDQNPLSEDSSLWCDLLNGALSEVNWLEIIESNQEE